MLIFLRQRNMTLVGSFTKNIWHGSTIGIALTIYSYYSTGACVFKPFEERDGKFFLKDCAEDLPIFELS